MDFSQAEQEIAEISDRLTADQFDLVIPVCQQSIELLNQVCEAIISANQAKYSKQLFFNDHVTLQRILTTAMETIFKCRSIQNSFEFKTLLNEEEDPEPLDQNSPPHHPDLSPEHTQTAIKKLIKASKMLNAQLINLNNLVMDILEN
ncbi:hypothetical protein [Piscirickettsia litoralis]|uniref:Uncharacterized protein n=1 Tax=Piscirickettsia litoralis TaxID=1891921 RepID=A0ABX3A3S2_9GAMM|nr:hypothetical protein [Piscirickettsia litoralis]ODN43483.1 hypothetical protein BGC07_11830 [Piscirickettsia litoralis]